VLGLDHHRQDVADSLMDFIRDTMPFDVQVTVPTPFPGTPFHDQLAREGRLLEAEAHERCTLFDVNFRPKGMSVEDLRGIMRRLAVELYNEGFTQERRERFRRASRAGRSQHARAASACARSSIRTSSSVPC
jgi:radical SAM superfamily enzyme YgiQ (UPF0313 family)